MKGATVLRSLSLEEIGERVKRLRGLSGMSGRQLAVTIDKPTNFQLVHKIEHGTLDSAHKWLEPIARTLTETGWESAYDYLVGRILLSELALRMEAGTVTLRHQGSRENNNHHRITELTRILCLPAFTPSVVFQVT